MEKRRNGIIIFDYTDYRKYLSDFYQEQKQRRTSFSYRYFARKAGINSVGLYKDVVEGRQNLGRALIFKFSAAIGHTRKEAEYFENMVYFNEAKSAGERMMFFERMVAGQGSRAKMIETSKYEYYHTWYYSAVRALLSCRKFKNDPADHKVIAKTMNPPIRPDQAKKAVIVLERLGFISRDKEGFYTVTDNAITTGTLKPDRNVSALNVVNFQKEMMKLAEGAFDRFGSEKLSMSTLTLGISEKTALEIKDDLAALRSRIAGMAQKDTAADRIFQLNIQLFPVSDKCGGGTV
jgi:uncharacterized protein (TIGR02147 family)